MARIVERATDRELVSKRGVRSLSGLIAMAAMHLLAVTSARAAAVTVGPIVIAVPEGFEAAQTQRLSKTLVPAWTGAARGGSLKPLLQINIVDFGSPPGKPAAPQDLGLCADRYLRQFLGGIEQRRTNYVSSPIAHIQLAGLPAARATW